MEHLCLLHAGPTLMRSSLCQCYHTIGSGQLVHFVTQEWNLQTPCHKIITSLIVLKGHPVFTSDHFHCSAIYTYLLQSSLLAMIIQVAKQCLAVPKINYHCQILIKIHITAHEQVEAF